MCMCSELTMAPEEAHNLCIESWRTWYTLLQYSLALDTFRCSHCCIIPVRRTYLQLAYLLEFGSGSGNHASVL